MSWTTLWLLRNEVLLTLLIVFHLIADLQPSRTGYRLINSTLVLFGLVTVASFLPVGPEGAVAEFGGMFLMDSLRWMLKGLLNLITFIVLLQSAGWLTQPGNHLKAGAFFMLLFSTLIGMSMMISAGHFLLLYLGLETATIPLALLAAFDKKLRRSAEAGIKLLMNSAVASAILLLGLSLIYGGCGTLYYPEVTARMSADPVLLTGLALVITGFAFKLSLAPFHFWTADVYEGAPLPVTMYLSVVSKGAAIFALGLLLYQVFLPMAEYWNGMAKMLAMVTMIIGNLFALRQKNLKRLLAFSAIAQAGFLMLGFITAEYLGFTTVVYFMLIYALSNLAAFGVVAVGVNFSGAERIEDLKGLYINNKGLSLIMLVALFSLAGIPPVAGFFGKFFLFTAAASQGEYLVVLFAVLNATLSLYYYLMVVKAMFIDKTESPLPAINTSAYEKLAFGLCLLGIFGIGFASPVYALIAAAVEKLG